MRVEGRNTGIPTMVGAMRENGSPDPIFLTDEDRSYFTVVLPIHPKVRISENTLPNTLSNTLPNTLTSSGDALPKRAGNADVVASLIEAIRQHPGRRIPFYAGLLNKGERTLMRYLSCDLKDKVQFRGAPKTGGYYAI